MAIRLKSANSSLGRIKVETLSGLSAQLAGSADQAPSRVGSIASSLTDVVADLIGVYQSSSSYVGALSASLDGVTGRLASSEPAASGFYDDAYSTYSTWYVDATNGVNTANPGTDRRAPGYVYRSIQNAMSDVFYPGNGGSRRIIVRQGTYQLSETYAYDAAHGRYNSGYGVMGGGVSHTQRCVLMGDPALSPANMPVIDGELTYSPCFNMGTPYYLGPNADNKYMTFRKLKIVNLNGNCFSFYCGGGTSSHNCILEYLLLTGTRDPNIGTGTGAGSSGLVYYPWPSAGEGDDLTVRYCKIIDLQSTGTARSNNLAVLGSYGLVGMTAHNNYVEDVPRGFKYKTANTALQTRWRIYNNIFNYVDSAVNTTSAGYSPSDQTPTPEDLEVYNNLFYRCGEAIGSANAAGWNIRKPICKIYNNTVAEDCGTMFSWGGQTDVQVYDNLSFATSKHVGSLAEIDYPNGPLAFTYFDHNAYGGAARWTLQWTPNYGYYHLYSYDTLAKWQAAYTSPLDHAGNPTATPPVDLVTLPGNHNPDQNSVTVPSLAAACPNYASRDYTLAAGSPLLTAGRYGGPVGCNMASLGPGW